MDNGFFPPLDDQSSVSDPIDQAGIDILGQVAQVDQRTASQLRS